MVKRVGILFGMEREFPGVLAAEINRRSKGEVHCEPVTIGALRIDRKVPYDLILDRISHDVPFYRILLKQCMIEGAQVINNPIWAAADDKYFGTIVAARAGVAVPRTVLLPSKRHPPGTEGTSFSNLRFPLEWEEVFDYLHFPIYLKPSSGGGWKNVYRCANPEEFFHAYEQSGDICMMAQEEIEFQEYYRCYVIGRDNVHLMRYDPKLFFHERYIRNPPPIEAKLKERLDRDCRALCESLGYDFNTVELAVRDGIPYAIDFTNPCPDAAPQSVGDANFGWIVNASAELLMRRVQEPRPIELTGDWPERTS